MVLPFSPHKAGEVHNHYLISLLVISQLRGHLQEARSMLTLISLSEILFPLLTSAFLGQGKVNLWSSFVLPTGFIYLFFSIVIPSVPANCNTPGVAFLFSE